MMGCASLNPHIDVRLKRNLHTAMDAPDTSSPLSIGQLARRTGASIRSLRHYDEHGLLASRRAANGYRVFPPVAVTQVRQIQRLIESGFSIADIRGFPDCMRLIEGAAMCPETTPAQRRRLDDLERRIADLERRRASLLAMLSGSDGSA